MCSIVRISPALMIAGATSDVATCCRIACVILHGTLSRVWRCKPDTLTSVDMRQMDNVDEEGPCDACDLFLRHPATNISVGR